MVRYRASNLDCDVRSFKNQCCPKAPAHKILRSIYQGARDLARKIAITDAYVDEQQRRKKVEMLFAHLKRILKLDRLRLRGPNGAQDEFHLAATDKASANWPSWRRNRRERTKYNCSKKQSAV